MACCVLVLPTVGQLGNKNKTNMKKIEITKTVGRKYGHFPGNDYHDVKVTVTRSAKGRWRVSVLETWGSCQGHDEEHGRKEAYASGDSLEGVGEKANVAARQAGINEQYLVQALSKAIAVADEEAEEEEQEDSILLENIPIAELQAELARR